MGKRGNIGFIGAGNMATALVKGLIQSGVYGRERIMASDKNEEALQRIAEAFGIRTFASNRDLARESDVIVLAVKPQAMNGVLGEIRGEVRPDRLVISIAAGISMRSIREAFGLRSPIVRVMPNTPALVQKGASALAGNDQAGPEEMAVAREIFGAVGETVEVEEGKMDAVTALSGSGPGYLFRIMECLVEAGVAVGLERETAYGLVVQTFLGSALLAKESGEELPVLRRRVTSPGGTTEAGLAVLDRMGLEEMIRRAVEAACDRSVELGKK